MKRAYRIDIYTEPSQSQPTGFAGRFTCEAGGWREAVEKLEAEMQQRPESDGCRFEYCHSLPGFCRNPE